VLETQKLDNNSKDTQSAFHKLYHLNVTDMRYLEECSRNECDILFIVE